jgi:hypothetical protein
MLKRIFSICIVFFVMLGVSFAGYSNSEMIEAANNLASGRIINDHSKKPSAYNLGSHVLRQEIAAVAR